MNTIDTSDLKQKHPHIMKKVEAMWGTKECRDYLMHLIKDSRDGARAGFDFTVASSILQLLIRHDELFPQYNIIEDPAVRPFTFSPARVVQEAPADWKLFKGVAMVVAIILVLAFVHHIINFIS